MHLLRLLSSHHSTQVLDNFDGIIVWNGGTPTCADTVTTIDQDQWDRREIVLRFNTHSIFYHVVEQSIVVRMEDRSGDSRDLGENVTSASSVFTTLISALLYP